MLATSARGRGDLGHLAVQHAIADEVPDVRRNPLRAGLDELVVVQLVDLLREHLDLTGKHLDELAQHPAVLGVSQPVDDGQQMVEPIGDRQFWRWRSWHLHEIVERSGSESEQLGGDGRTGRSDPARARRRAVTATSSALPR